MRLTESIYSTTESRNRFLTKRVWERLLNSPHGRKDERRKVESFCQQPTSLKFLDFTILRRDENND